MGGLRRWEFFSSLAVFDQFIAALMGTFEGLYHLGRFKGDVRGVVTWSLRCGMAEKAARWALCLMTPDVCVSGVATVRLVACRAAAVSGVRSDCIVTFTVMARKSGGDAGAESWT